MALSPEIIAQLQELHRQYQARPTTLEQIKALPITGNPSGGLGNREDVSPEQILQQLETPGGWFGPRIDVQGTPLNAPSAITGLIPLENFGFPIGEFPSGTGQDVAARLNSMSPVERARLVNRDGTLISKDDPANPFGIDLWKAGTDWPYKDFGVNNTPTSFMDMLGLYLTAAIAGAGALGIGGGVGAGAAEGTGLGLAEAGAAGGTLAGGGAAGGLEFASSYLPTQTMEGLIQAGMTQPEIFGAFGQALTYPGQLALPASISPELAASFSSSIGEITAAAQTAGLTPMQLLQKIPPGSTSLIKRLASGDASAKDYLTAGVGAAGVLGGAAALGGAMRGGLGGSTTQTSQTNVPPLSQEERDLIAINTELARRQLAAIDQLQPFQKEMLEMSLAQMRQQAQQDAVTSSAITPEEQKAAIRAEFERSQKLGPMQDEIMQIQLENLRRNGAATPEQEALIKRATDTAISSAHGDIDAATSRGIGLIADELANARGLRLSDSPMSSEAALLSREGLIQKGGIERSLRANQANAQLNYPLAVTQLQSQVSALPSQIAASSREFQETLRQRAFQNRLAMTGQATSTGLGLASAGGGNAALSALTQNRLAGATNTTTASRGLGLSDIGGVAGGIGGLLTGLDRLGLFS